MTGDDTAAKLLGTTARLESRGVAGECRGTGFVYEVRIDGGGTRTFLVANKHQFEAASAELCLRLVPRGFDGLPSWGQELTFELTHPGPRWFAHPADLDIAVMPLEPVVAEPGSLLAVSADVALSSAQEHAAAAVESILTVGYPNGLYDPVNLTPISREGITATPIGLDYEGLPAFCIDAATFPGSSGSPVFRLEADPHARVRFGILGRRVTLAGVVAALHERQAVGDVRRVDATKGFELVVRDPMHLGIVLKARTIDECIDVALEAVNLRRAAAPAVELPTEHVA